MRILVTKQGNVIIQEIDDTMPIITQNIKRIYYISNQLKFKLYF